MEVAAGAIAFFQLLDRVIQTSKHIIDTVKDAPNDIRIIHSEIVTPAYSQPMSRLNTVGATFLAGNNGTLQQCQTALEGLERLLPRNTVFLSPGKRRKTCEITLAALGWVFKESKARKFLAEISQQKSTILLGLSEGIARDIQTIKDDIGQIREAMQDNLTSQTRHSVLDWLQSTNPCAKHNDSFQNHESETSQWIHQTSEWQEFLSTNPITNFLWLHGIPGCGKTVLASYLIEQVKTVCENHEDMGYVFYYCVQNTQDDTGPFLRWAISSLCRRSSFVPKPLINAYNEKCEPPVKDLLEILQNLLIRFKRVFIILDAVDESKNRENLLDTLRALSQFHNVRLLATSRKYYDIEKVVADISMLLSMSNPFVDHDIRLAVRSKLDRSTRLQKWRKFCPEMEDAIANGAQGMFRWAICQLHILERLHPTTDLHAELKNLPPDLDAAYERIFQQIPEQHQRIVRQVLLWIFGHDDIIRFHDYRFTHAPIPLRVLVDGTSADLYEQDCLLRKAYDSELIRDLCGCLIAVQPNIVGEQDLEDWDGSQLDADEELVEVVSCAHYTVKEYLFSERIRSSSAAYFALENTAAALEFATSIFTQAFAFTTQPEPFNWIDSAQGYAFLCSGLLVIQNLSSLEHWIYANKTLFNQICRFLDPSRPHYRSFTCLRDVYFGDRLGHISRMASTLEWELPLSDLDASILANILHYGRIDIAEEWVKDNVKALCASQHKARIFVDGWSAESGWRLRSCSGPLPAILASSLDSSRSVDWFIEYANSAIDPTAESVVEIGLGVECCFCLE